VEDYVPSRACRKSETESLETQTRVRRRVRLCPSYLALQRL
jgi:hypothetical protein